MKSSVTVTGHPLHPMLVPIPIAGFLLALAGDIAFVLTGAGFWWTFATLMLGIGIAGALAAAIPGLADYFRVLDRAGAAASGDATLHLVLNVTLVSIMVADLFLRVAFDATGGPLLALCVVLTVAGNAVLGYAGWLGGNLVFRHRIGVEEPEERLRVTLAPAEREPVREERE